MPREVLSWDRAPLARIWRRARQRRAVPRRSRRLVGALRRPARGRGAELAVGVAPYAQWAAGRHCDALAQRFRQHPQDHLDALRVAVRTALRQAPRGAAGQVVGIGVDTTGSSPLSVAADGTALGLLP